MADSILASFETWLDEHQPFVAGLDKIRSLAEGFSFRIFEQKDAARVAPHFKSYQTAIDSLKRFWPGYLDKGVEYRQIISDPETNMRDKIMLVDLSEAHGHIFHNAAVLHLETLSKDQKQPDADFENALKELWLSQIRYFERGDRQRRQAMIDYLSAHSVLGKIIRLRATQFHGSPTLLRMHPAFWGLFLFSRTRRADNAHFPIQSGSAEDYWQRTLAKWNGPHPDPGNHYVSDFLAEIGTNPGLYPIYEPLPRDFTDPKAAPRGVYLHRSKAHGRDDFLVVNTADRSRAVFCTKGVGADLDRVMAAITRERTSSALAGFWDTKPAGSESTAPLPFEYQFIQGHPTWSLLGFCIDVGNLGEQLGRDFRNFAKMYDFVVRWQAAARSQPRSLAGAIIDWLPRVFVEPYACVEVSRRYTDRLRPPIGRPALLQAKTANRSKPDKPQAKDDAYLGLPVQIVTGAPCETSLRLQKVGHGAAPAYDYECPELESREWARCVGPIHAEILDAVERDAGSQPEAVKSRLAVAYQLAAILLASYIAFQKNGLLTGSANPSFAPRNFGSGPRDSPDWTPLEDAAKKLSLQQVELESVSNSLREYIGRSLAIYDLWRRLYTDKKSFPDALRGLMPAPTGKPDLLEQMSKKAKLDSPGSSASARLARNLIKDLIDVTC